MKKIFILILMACLAYSKTYEGTYKISYGIFGELGIAKTKLIINNDKYEIIINAKATGIAKFLSNGKEEIYQSFGNIKNNEFTSTKYVTQTKTNSKEKTKIYNFDYENKVINLETNSKYLETSFVSSNQNYETESKWVSSNSLSKNNFFTTNDILSLFFNVSKNINLMDKTKNYEYKTLGAKAENGKINFYFPNNTDKIFLDEFFENKEEKLIVTLNQPIFSSKNGELLISVNKNGFCNKAILKDVIMFGDITGELIEFKIKD